LLSLATVRCDVLERVIGVVTWRFCLRRELFACLQHVYAFIHAGKNGEGRTTPLNLRLWPSVRDELRNVRDLLPFARVRLDRPTAPVVVCTDSEGPSSRSNGGGAVVYCEPGSAVIEQLRVSGPRQTPLHCDPEYLGTLWAQDWCLGVAVRWRYREAIHLTELEAVLLWLKRCLRDPRLCGSRYVLLCDNTPVVYACRKGRSSSGRFLLVLRRLTALNLAGDFELVPC